MTMPPDSQSTIKPPVSRICRLKNHRIFRDFTWPAGLHDFGRFNLIYGWNASGKSTLAKLFANIERSENIVEGEAEVVVNGNRVNGSNFANTAGLPALRVFTREAVSSSIFTGGTDLAPIYYFGKENVETQKRLDELKNNRAVLERQQSEAQTAKTSTERELDRFCIEQARLVKELLTAPGSQYNNYDKAGFRRACEARSASEHASRLLPEADKDRLRQEKDAVVRPSICPVQGIPVQLSSLSRTVADVLNRTVVSQVIVSLAANPTESAWVKQGLALHSGSTESQTCKFCGNLILEDRLRALEGHFNDQYSHFLLDIEAVKAEIEDTICSLEGLTIPDPATLYDYLSATYLTERDGLLTGVAAGKRYLSTLLAAVQDKRDRPFESLSLSDLVAEEDVGADIPSTERVKTLNSIIESHNEHTQNFDQKKAAARKTLEEGLVAEAYPRYKELLDAAAKAGGATNVLGENVRQIGAEISTLEAVLIEHQTPAEELNAELRSFLGRADLMLAVQASGYAVTRNGERASNLSEGEKTAIAFLYFLKSLRDRSFDLERGVVVVDDPICSLDNNALFSAFGYMKERTKDSGQLIILTHNFSFYRLVKNWFHHLKGQNKADVTKRPARFFMLTRNASPTGDTTTITRLPNLLETHESEYHYLFKRIHEASQLQSNPDNLAEFYSLPNMARRLLETFTAFRYPAHAGDLSVKMENMAFDEAKKVAILRFLNTFSHSSQISGAEHDLTLLMETPKILGAIMEIIESEDKSHFEQMVACTTSGLTGTDNGQSFSSEPSPL